MQQNTIKPNIQDQKARKRVGRGDGSGSGNYSGRGMNGQGQRSGGNKRPGFEGGQTPLSRRMPKLKGFKNINRINYQVVNVGTLDKTFAGETKEITAELLYKKSLIKSAKKPVKILGNGEIKEKLTVIADSISKSAEEKISKAGGKAQEIVKEKRKEKKKHDA